MGRKTITLETWTERFEVVHGKKYQYIQVDRDASRTVTLYCSIHNKQETVSASAHVKGCLPMCCAQTGAPKKSEAEWKQRLEFIYSDKTYTISDYNITDGTVKVHCGTHNEDHTCKFTYLSRGKGAPCCALERRNTARCLPEDQRKEGYVPFAQRTQAQWIRAFEEVHGTSFQNYTFPTGWEPTPDAGNTTIECKCASCGGFIAGRVKGFLRRDTKRTKQIRCRNCKGE